MPGRSGVTLLESWWGSQPSWLGTVDSESGFFPFFGLGVVRVPACLSFCWPSHARCRQPAEIHACRHTFAYTHMHACIQTSRKSAALGSQTLRASCIGQGGPSTLPERGASRTMLSIQRRSYSPNPGVLPGMSLRFRLKMFAPCQLLSQCAVQGFIRCAFSLLPWKSSESLSASNSGGVCSPLHLYSLVLLPASKCCSVASRKVTKVDPLHGCGFCHSD